MVVSNRIELEEYSTYPNNNNRKKAPVATSAAIATATATAATPAAGEEAPFPRIGTVSGSSSINSTSSVQTARILFLQTGGTIDKDYPQTTQRRGFEIGAPALQRIIDERLRGLPSFEYTLATVCRV